MIQKWIHQPHGAHQRQDNAQLMKTQPHRNPRRLKQQHRVEHHHHQGGQVVLGKGYHRRDIENRHQKLTQGIQPVHRGVPRSQLIHFPQLQLSVI